MAAPPSLHLSLATWLSLLALGLALWLIITYAGLIMGLVWILLGAFLLSLAMRPLAERLVRRQIPRGLTVLAVYVGLVGLLAVLGILLVPVIQAETELLRTHGAALLQTALSRLTASPALSRWLPNSSMLTQELSGLAGSLFPTFVSTVTGVGQMTIDFLVILVLAYFLTTDDTIGRRLLRALVPRQHRDRVVAVVDRVDDRLTQWVWAQAAIALYFAVTFGVGLFFLGVPFALTIALVGGVLEVVPYLGGATALLLGVFSALTVDPWLALWVALLYLVVAQVQSHIVAPMLYGRAMHLHPAGVLVALVAGAELKGIVGVFFAIPLLVIGMTLLEEWRASAMTPAGDQPAPVTPVDRPASAGKDES